jgi:hypothetical protein
VPGALVDVAVASGGRRDAGPGHGPFRVEVRSPYAGHPT